MARRHAGQRQNIVLQGIGEARNGHEEKAEARGVLLGNPWQLEISFFQQAQQQLPQPGVHHAVGRQQMQGQDSEHDQHAVGAAELHPQKNQKQADGKPQHGQQGIEQDKQSRRRGLVHDSPQKARALVFDQGIEQPGQEAGSQQADAQQRVAGRFFHGSTVPASLPP